MLVIFYYLFVFIILLVFILNDRKVYIFVFYFLKWFMKRISWLIDEGVKKMELCEIIEVENFLMVKVGKLVSYKRLYMFIRLLKYFNGFVINFLLVN